MYFSLRGTLISKSVINAKQKPSLNLFLERRKSAFAPAYFYSCACFAEYFHESVFIFRKISILQFMM